MIAGSKAAVERADASQSPRAKRADAAAGQRALHCALMSRGWYHSSVAEIELRVPTIPVLNN